MKCSHCHKDMIEHGFQYEVYFHVHKDCKDNFKKKLITEMEIPDKFTDNTKTCPKCNYPFETDHKD